MQFVRSGFRAVTRQPALFFAELAWRWAFGAAAWTLVFLSIHSFLASITVSEAEVRLARTWQPFLVADVAARVLATHGVAALRATVILIIGIAVLWIFAASLGRSATLKYLCGTRLRPVRWSALLSPHVLRALITLAALAAWFGGLILVGAVFPDPQSNLGTMFLAGFGILFLIGLCWSVANWFLALAPIFIVRDGRGALASISDSFALYQSRTADYLAVASWFGFFRFVALAFALLISAVPLGMVGRNSPAAITLIGVFIALTYFAAADFLYMARLAAFVALAQPAALPAAGLQTQLAPTP